MFFKIFGNGDPRRLFIAAINGNEEAIPRPILELLARDIDITRGRLILVSLSGGYPYISTLDKAYYDSTAGKKLLSIIREYRPRIYLELHSYEIKNHSRQTDPD